ncbi:Helicase conserved domain containing protein, partial [Reticulomyxa filosa]
AEVPKSFYRIMGVSGNLKTLSEPERGVIEKDYRMSKYTYMPSLFGSNNLIFAEQKDIFIVEESYYFTTLKKEIDDRLVGTNPETKRAVLVFFESKKTIDGFL